LGIERDIVGGCEGYLGVVCLQAHRGGTRLVNFERRAWHCRRIQRSNVDGRERTTALLLAGGGQTARAEDVVTWQGREHVYIY
jgi:hypothetical protein